MSRTYDEAEVAEVSELARKLGRVEADREHERAAQQAAEEQRLADLIAAEQWAAAEETPAASTTTTGSLLERVAQLQAQPVDLPAAIAAATSDGARRGVPAILDAGTLERLSVEQIAELKHAAPRLYRDSLDRFAGIVNRPMAGARQ